MTPRSVLAQLSDTHIGAPPAGGRSPGDGLRRALADPRIAAADALLLTGDLTDQGAPAEYAALRDALSTWRKPLYPLPGNHDTREGFRAAFADLPFLPREGPLHYVVEHLPFRLVVWDVMQPGRVGGVVTEAAAEWLAAALAARPESPVMLAMHFPPSHTHDPAFAQHGLDGAARALAVIEAHPQVRRIVCGHMHDVAVDQFGSTAVAVAPSTAWRYLPPAFAGANPPVREAGPCGGLLHVWSANAFTTHFAAV